jgi:hypothetical protein
MRISCWLILSILTVAGIQPRHGGAQELCGIDEIFYDGFQARSFVSITQIPGAVMSAGLEQDITGTLASVVVTSPSGTISASRVDVTGTFVGPVNTGITVNGIYGITVNGTFLVPDVPLTAGSNTLMVQALTLTGQTATASGSVTQGGSPPVVSIEPDHKFGYAPFIVNFTYAFGTLPSGKPVQSITVNFRGTGADDYTGALAGTPTSYTYTTPGLYSPRLLVTDTDGNAYAATQPILIQDIAAQRSMVCDVYAYLKDRMNAQDATGAANVFQPADRGNYLTFFNALGTNLPTVAQQLGVVIDGQLGTGFAELLLERDDTTAQTRTGFPLRMTQGSDGVWRISEM